MTSLGKIELITGSMFSGKTSTLIRKAERYTFANKKCIVLKWYRDKRYAPEGVQSHIITHNNFAYECVPVSNDEINIMNTTFYDTILKRFNVILIDEGQFFDKIAEYADFLANNGHIVIITALVGTYERKPFLNILNVIPLCDDITFLKAVCMGCLSEDAPFIKLASGVERPNTIESIGGKEKYMSVCRSCHIGTNKQNISD